MEKTIELTVKIPDTNATDSEIEAYLEFEFGYNGSISVNNPLEKSGEVNVINMYIRD